MTMSHDIYGKGYVPPERFETEPFDPTPYHYILVDTLTQELIAEIPLIGVTYGSGVSKAGDFSGNIPLAGADVVPGLDMYDATRPIRTSLYAVRNRKVVWGGIIWTRNYTLNGRQIALSCSSFESYLFKRHIWHTLLYPNTVDNYDIARSLIDHMANDFSLVDLPTDPAETWPSAADIGITYGIEMSGKFQLQAQNWEAGSLTTFGDALSAMANNLNGFEWNIVCSFNEITKEFIRQLTFRATPPGQLPTGVEFTGERTGLQTNIFEYPGSIVDLGLDELGDASATRYFVVGGAPEGVEGDFRPIGSWNNEAYLNDGWPLIEQVESSKHDTATLVATLEQYAQVYGRRARPVVPTWSIGVNASADPEFGTYDLGDWCRIIVEDDFVTARLAAVYDYTQDETVKRIMSWSVSVPDVPQEPEIVTLELADEWKEPS